MREASRDEHGEQDIEADYHLFKLLEVVYQRLKRYGDAASIANACVLIDRKYDFQDRLASSLFLLGEDLCWLKSYSDAQNVLRESLGLVRRYNLGHEFEQSVIEWLIVATWYLNQFEMAIELILENASGNRINKDFKGKHVVVREDDLLIQKFTDRPEFTKINEHVLHLLVLPKGFTFQDIEQWNENVLRNRPEIAVGYNPVLFYKT